MSFAARSSTSRSQRLRAPSSFQRLATRSSTPAAALRARRARPVVLSPSLRICASVDDLSREQNGEELGSFGENMQVPTSINMIGHQLGGGGAATLQRSKMDLSQAETQSQAKTDDTGGGGNNGKNINNGGGGDGDEGDDDDYFDDEDDDGEGEGVFSRRPHIPELFDRASIECVLQEWFKTLYSLPHGIRQAVEMSLVSSAQLVRFISMDNRPNLIRAVTRATPVEFSRAFVGRLMGEPSFLLKFGFEQGLTATVAMAYEVKHRGDRLKSELDLAAVNVVSLMACNAAIVWLVCPTRTFGSMHKFPWQRMLSVLPNHAFDTCGPLRNYTLGSRAMGFLYKMGQLCTVGMGIGAAAGAASNGLVALRKEENYKPSLPVHDIVTSAVGMGACAGISGNFRYQALGGFDRWATQHFNSLPLTLSVSGIARFVNQMAAEPLRLHWQRLPAKAPKRVKTVQKVVRRKVKKVKRVKKAPAPVAAEAGLA